MTHHTHEYPRIIKPEHLAQAIAQTRRVVYPDDWTAAVCSPGYR